MHGGTGVLGLLHTNSNVPQVASLNSESVSVPFGTAVAKKNGRQNKMRKTQYERLIERGGRGMTRGHDHHPGRRAVRFFLSATVATRATRPIIPKTPPTINNAIAVILVRNAGERHLRTFVLICVAPAALRSLPCVVHAVGIWAAVNPQ